MLCNINIRKAASRVCYSQRMRIERVDPNEYVWGDLDDAYRAEFLDQPDELKLNFIKNFPIDKYNVGLKDADPATGWNRGFFKGQDVAEESGEEGRRPMSSPIWMYAWLMEQGRVEEASRVLFAISQQTGISFERLKNEFTLNDYYEKNPKNYTYLDKDKGSSGWNKGFFKGYEHMGERSRKVYWPGVGMDGDTRTDVDRSRGSYADGFGDYDSERARIAAENENTINSMIWTNEMFDSVFNTYNDDILYVDKDNYNKFLNIKRDRDLIATWVGVVVPIVYATVLFIAGMWEVYLFVTGGGDGPLKPNWGLLLLPVIMYIAYKSINSYSMIKISF